MAILKTNSQRIGAINYFLILTLCTCTVCMLIFQLGCSSTRNVTESTIAQTCPQSTNIETGAAIPSKSILLSGNFITSAKNPRPIAVHDTSTNVSEVFFITTSTITDRMSLLYQPKSLFTGSISMATSNHLLIGGSYSWAVGNLYEVPSQASKYLDGSASSYSFFLRLNTYTKPWSFSWKPELFFGHVTGETFWNEDSLYNSHPVDIGFASLSNTFVLRYQVQKSLGFYGGANFISLPYAVSNKELEKTVYANLYTGFEVKFLDQYAASVYVLNPMSSSKIKHTFPLQFGMKLEWQLLLKKQEEAD